MSELSGIRNENDLLNRLAEVERAVASLQRQNLRVGALSEMSADLGEFWGGDIFALESGLYPDDPNATGVFLSMNGYTIDGVTYRFGAVKNGTIVLGVTTEGQTVTGAGSGSIDQGLVLNGVLTILSQLATYGGYTRQMRMRMNLPNETNVPGGNSIPAASWEYQEPAVNELLVNGTFNTNVANWKGLLSKASGYSGKYGEALGALVTGTITANSSIVTIAIHPITGDIYVGGTFTQINGVAANYIAVMDIETSVWAPLAAQVNNNVFALAFDAGGNLYAGGAFHTAGGTTVNHIAKWNGSAWSALGVTGVNADVFSIAISGTDVYVGGDFTTAAGMTVNYIAKWDTVGLAWSALGVTGVNAHVECLLFIGTDLYAGGRFTTAAGMTVNYIAKWDTVGLAWSALDDGTPGVEDWVNCLATDGVNLFVGGWFEDAGSVADVYCIAYWDGADWHKLGDGVPDFIKNTSNVKSIGIISNGDAYVSCSSSTFSTRIFKYKASDLTFSQFAIPTTPVYVGYHDAMAVDSDDTIYFGSAHTAMDGITSKLITAYTSKVYCDKFALTAGDNSPYAFSGYLYNPLGKSVQLSIKWYDSGDSYISEDVIYLGSTALGWTNYTLSPTPPPTAGKGQIYLTLSGDFMISQVGLDSVSFTESSADTYGIMLHPYPLAIIDSAVERIVSAGAFRLFSPRAPTISLLPITWQYDETSGIDTTILSDNPTTNYGTAVTINVGENSGSARISRTLIKPDFSTIPSDRTVSAAKLKLKIQADYSSNTRTLRVYPLKVDFVEGQATWNIRKTGTNWTTAGGFDPADCEQTDIGSVSVPHDSAVGSWIEISLDASVINQFIAGTKTYYGFLLKMDTESDDGWQLHSSSAATATDRPILELTIVDGCTNGAHKVKDVFVDAYGKTLGSAESNSVTVDADNPLITGSIELGPFGTTQRERYMTKAGGTTFYLAKTIADNTTTTCVIGIDDDDLVIEEPGANTSGSRALKRHYFTVHGHEVRTSATLTRPTSQIDLAYTAAAAANNGDEFYFDFDCVGGTYTLVYILWHSTYFGKVDIYIDNALVEGGYDLYAGSGAVDIHTGTGITITGDGVHTLMFKVNGKNGSSTDYSFGAVMISGYRTGA